MGQREMIITDRAKAGYMRSKTVTPTHARRDIEHWKISSLPRDNSQTNLIASVCPVRRQRAQLASPG
jgi:hypothetical protein